MFVPTTSPSHYPFNIITGWTTEATYQTADFLFSTPEGMKIVNECLEYCSIIRGLSFEEQIKKIEAWLQVNLADLEIRELIDWSLIAFTFIDECLELR